MFQILHLGMMYDILLLWHSGQILLFQRLSMSVWKVKTEYSDRLKRWKVLLITIVYAVASTKCLDIVTFFIHQPMEVISTHKPFSFSG